MPEAQVYYEALKQGDHAALRKLAEEAGYNVAFDPLATPLMTRTDEGRLKFFDSVDRIYFPPIYAFKLEEYNKQRIPKEYWENRYTDLFTLTRVHGGYEGFVDCWRANHQEKISLSKGEVPQPYDAGYDDDADYNTNGVLFISRIRAQHPHNRFKKQGVKLGTSAIDSLVEEAVQELKIRALSPI